MRGNLKYYQFELPLHGHGARSGPRSAWQQRTNERVTSPTEDCDQGYIRRPNTRTSLYSSACASPSRTPSPCPSQRESHDCISMGQDKTSNQSAQRILVGSALRRPHASEFSPLDYQSMPDVGKSQRKPYKNDYACTVFTYADRPVSAKHVPKHLGKHTKSSLLRSHSVSCGSLDSVSSSSSSITSRPSSARENKRLCVVREDYRLFKTGSGPRQTPPHGQSMHAFLTGARYNSARHLDARTLSKLGVYIPKMDLNTFFVKDEPRVSDEDDVTATSDDLNDTAEDIDDSSCEMAVKDKAVNTDPHYLSMSHWQSAEWRSGRSKPDPGTRGHTAPLNRYKAVKAYYCDYDKQKKASGARPGTSR